MTLAPAAAVATLPAPLRLTPRNVVCVTKITDALDLPALAAAIPGAEYNSKRFPGMIVRMSNPRAAALVFNSGKLVLTGLPHPDAIARADMLASDLDTMTAERDQPRADLDTLRTRADQAEAVAAERLTRIAELRADLDAERERSRSDVIQAAALAVRAALPRSSTTAAETTRRTLRERVRDWLNR